MKRHRNRTFIHFSTAFLLCLLYGCSGEKKPEQPPAAEAAKPAAVPSQSPAGQLIAVPEQLPKREIPVLVTDVKGSDDFAHELRKILALEAAAEFSDASKLAREVEERFKDHTDREDILGVIQRLKEERRAATGLGFAIQNLGSDRPEVADVARQKILEAGDVGMIYLRKIVREEGEGAAAVEAIRLLAIMRDRHSVPLFIDRLRQKPSEPLRVALSGALRELASVKNPVVLREMFRMVRADVTYEHRDLAGKLCAIYAEDLRRNKDEFHQILDDPEAFNVLNRYVSSALEIGSPEAQIWAERQAPLVGILKPGLHGFYFADVELDKLVFERLDKQINLRHTDYKLPDGRTNNIGMRWTGYINIKTAGRYNFYLKADDGARLYIQEKELINVWHHGGGKEYSAQGQMAKGLHPIRIEHYNGGGSGYIEFSWEGPGFKKQAVRDVLWTPPWRGMK